MSILQDIVDGWTALIIKEPVTEELASKRSAICVGCEHMNTLPGGFYLHCGKCGCYLPAKIRSKNSKCPIDKWGSTD